MAPPPKRPQQPPRAAANYSTVTTTGVEPVVAATLSYTLLFVTGALFYFIEKQNKYVRFHAAQSIVVGLMLVVFATGVSMLSRLLVLIPFLGWLGVLLVNLSVSLAVFAIWIVLMVKAYSGEKWELPLAGELARRMA